MRPYLPDKIIKKAFVSSIISSDILKELISLGVNPLKLSPSDKLNSELRYHPDLLTLNIEPEVWLFDESYNKKTSEFPDFLKMVFYGSNIGPIYPNDCVFNALVTEKAVFVGKRTPISFMTEKSIIKVNQGYVKCSTVIVDENSYITADEAIYSALIKENLNVLKISDSAGCVLLNGYPNGFIGGCSGKLSKELLAFTGKIELHPDYQNIKAFCKNVGVIPYSLCGEKLYDYGGILPVSE